MKHLRFQSFLILFTLKTQFGFSSLDHIQHFFFFFFHKYGVSVILPSKDLCIRFYDPANSNVEINQVAIAVRSAYPVLERSI